MKLVVDDGGRSAAGYQGDAGDCVTRAIAIATEQPYEEVYKTLTWNQREYGERHKRSRVGQAILGRSKAPTARNGIFREVYDPYLYNLGWRFVPTMSFGSGCKVHLRADELPGGRIIVRVSRHITAMVGGVLHDTYDCSRGGTRCVYGYYRKCSCPPGYHDTFVNCRGY